MGILILLIVGLIAGFLADLLYRDVRLSLVGKTVAGVVGAILGGTLWHLITSCSAGACDLDFVVAGSLDLGSIVIATLGALLAIYLYIRYGRRDIL